MAQTEDEVFAGSQFPVPLSAAVAGTLEHVELVVQVERHQAVVLERRRIKSGAMEERELWRCGEVDSKTFLLAGTSRKALTASVEEGLKSKYHRGTSRLGVKFGRHVPGIVRVAQEKSHGRAVLQE